MTTTRRITSVLIAAVALAAPVHGQEPAALAARYVDERGGLTLAQATARALEREPSIRASRSDIAVARGARLQAGLRPNPSLTFERRDEPAGQDNQTSVGVEWPLDLFRRAGRVRTADQELVAALLVVADRERLLVADVRMAYGVVAAAVRDLTVADDEIAVAGRQLDLVRARVESGRTPPLERDLLDVELRRLEAERLLSAGRADAAMVVLKQALGMAPEEPLLLRDTIETLVSGHTSAAVVTTPTTTTARPDVLEAGARVTLAEARIDQARREGRVDISVYGTYMRMDAGFPQRGFSVAGVLEPVRSRFNYLAGGAMVTVPVFNRNEGRVAAAEAERAGAEARRDAVMLAARAEVAAAQARDLHAQRAVNLYAATIRGLARQNRDVVRQTFELGRGTVFEVLAEQRRYLDVERAFTAALREAWEARAALQRALGEMP